MREILWSFLFLLIGCTASAQYETTIYFQFDRYNLTNDAKLTLDSVVANHAIVAINISGHCDQLGSKEYNYRLSDKRAFVVRDYLVSKGLTAENIKTIRGFGEDRPVIDKLDENSRGANRRVTIAGVYNTSSKDSISPTATVKSDTPKVAHTTPQGSSQDKEKLLDEINDSSTKAGQNIILNNINFYGGSHRFLPTSFNALEELLDVMQRIPSLEIEIQGHICCIQGEGDGQDNDNFKPYLSLNRAKVVYGYLLRNGIDKKRMSYKGYGHKFPIYKIEQTEAERTANRRVEIKIIKK